MPQLRGGHDLHPVGLATVILSLRQDCFFLNQYKILDFLKTQYDLFQGKKISPFRGVDFKIFQYKNQKIPYITYFKTKKFHLSEGRILKFINTKTEKR